MADEPEATQSEDTTSTRDYVRMWEKWIMEGEDKYLHDQYTSQDAIEQEHVAVLDLDLSTMCKDRPDEFKTLMEHTSDSLDSIRNVFSRRDFDDVIFTVDKFDEKDMPDRKRRVRNLRSKDRNRIVTFNGLVRTAGPILNRLKLLKLRCEDDQIDILALQYTDTIDLSECRCPSCGALGNELTLLEEESVFVDFMNCEIEEDPEDLKGSQAQRITCELYGPMTENKKRLQIGDRVTVVGIYQVRPKKPKSTIYHGSVEVIGVIRKGRQHEDIIVTPEEELKFLEMSRDKDLLMKMVETVAPNILGHDIEKAAIILQMLGGNLSGKDRRGEIHILIVGDPGIGKSNLIKNVLRICPLAVKTSGAPTTTVGLTATVRKDDNLPGGWTLEAGAAVLADGGVLVVDEFDKMDDEVRGALHEIMEDRKTTISKANINAELNARCSVLALMNPENNRFNDYETVAEQVKLPPSLLSRFDLIFALRDKPDPVKDRKICQAIFRARQGKKVETAYDDDTLTKYIVYAKSKVTNIELSDEAETLIADSFLKVRASGGDDTVSITPRHAEAICRLAEACAKLRLSSKVELQDAQQAMGIIEYYLRTMCINPDTGKIDTNMVTAGMTDEEAKSKAGLKNFLIRNAHNLEAMSDKPGLIKVEDLEYAAMEENKMTEKIYQLGMKKLFEEGLIAMRYADTYIEWSGKKEKRLPGDSLDKY